MTTRARRARYRFRECHRESDLAYSLHRKDGSNGGGVVRLSVAARNKTRGRALRVIDSIMFLLLTSGGIRRAYLPRQHFIGLDETRPIASTA